MTTLDDAIAEKREAMGRVASGASDEWKAFMLAVIASVAATHSHFTMDDVWEAYDPLPGKPVEPDRRALGPLMHTAIIEGLVEKTEDFRLSRRRHATPIIVWRSLKFIVATVVDPSE